MAKNLLYRQCNLERPGDNGTVVKTTSWIPEVHKGIKIEKGVKVTLKDHLTNEVVPGGPWTVTSVSDATLPEAVAKKRAHDWGDHRKHSDV